MTKVCLTQQKFHHDKNILVSTNLLSGQIFVVTNIILSRNFCCNKLTFVAAILRLSQQKFCHNKHTFVLTKDVLSQACCYKTFVASTIILVAAPANDSVQGAAEGRDSSAGGVSDWKARRNTDAVQVLRVAW